jgi:hypothetical protein
MGKRTGKLPQIRVEPELELAAYRLASRDNRDLSDYLRIVITKHIVAHASTVLGMAGMVNLLRALQRPEGDAPSMEFAETDFDDGAGA